MTDILGEGLLEISYPKQILAFDTYRFDDVIALNPSEHYDRRDVQFPVDAVGRTGTLVAVVTQPPRASFGYIDKTARAGVEAPKQGSEVVLGAGTVRLTERTAGGRPQAERTAIGLDVPLDGDAVRSLLGVRVRIELRAGEAV